MEKSLSSKFGERQDVIKCHIFSCGGHLKLGHKSIHDMKHEKNNENFILFEGRASDKNEKKNPQIWLSVKCSNQKLKKKNLIDFNVRFRSTF